MQYNTKFLMLHMFVLQLLFVFSMIACQTIATNATAYKYLLRVHKIPVHMGENLPFTEMLKNGFDTSTGMAVKLNVNKRGTKSENWRKINAEQIASMPSNERQMIKSVLKKKHDKLLSMKQQYETLLTKTSVSIQMINPNIRSQSHTLQDLIDHKNIWKQQKQQLVKKIENIDKKLGELDAGLKQFDTSQRMQNTLRTLYSGTANSGKESKLYYQLDYPKSTQLHRLKTKSSDSKPAHIEEIDADVSYKYRYKPVSMEPIEPGEPLTVLHRPASSLEPKSNKANSKSIYLKLPKSDKPPTQLQEQIEPGTQKYIDMVLYGSKPIKPKSSQVNTYADVHAVHSVNRDTIEMTMSSINYLAIALGAVIIVVIGLFVYIIFKRNTNTNNQNYTAATIRMFNI